MAPPARASRRAWYDRRREGARLETSRSVGAAAAIALGLCALALPRVAETGVGYGVVSGWAEERIDTSLERNTVTFLSISGIKAVLATIEGSTVGVGFHLQIGDLIQPAYDYVDFVWHAFLYALSLLGLYKLVMETGILGIGFQVLGAGLVLWGAGALGAFAARPLDRWGRRLVWIGLVIAYAVPLSLLATHVVSERYLAPLEERTAARIEETTEPLGKAADRLSEVREKVSVLHPGRSLDAVQREARAIAVDVSDAIWDRLQAFLAYVLLLGVELLLLPFLSAFVIYRALGAALHAAGGAPRAED